MHLNSELRNRIKLAVSNQIESSVNMLKSANHTRFIEINIKKSNRYIQYISLPQERYYPKLLPAIGIV